MSEEKKAREIDLLDLFKSIGQGIRNAIDGFGNIILWNIKTALKYYWLILSFGVVGIILGVITFVNFEPAYQAEMVLRSNTIPAHEMVPYVNQLAKADFDKEQKAFAAIFKLDTTEVKKIVAIEAFYYVDLNKDDILDYVDYDNNFNAKDTTHTLHDKQLLVRATIKSPEQFNLMSDAIVSYIKRNKHFENANNARIEKTNVLVNAMDRELQLVDSLERKKFFETADAAHLQFGKSLVVGDGRQQLFYHDKMRIIKEINDKKDEILINPDIVSIVSPFPVQSTPTQSNFMALIIRLIELLLIGYVVSAGLELVAFIKKKL